VKLLVDEALQRRVAELLDAAGHEAVHAIEVGLQGAKDLMILNRARDDGRVVVTTDTDFGTLLALSGHNAPSVILLRGIDDHSDARAAGVLAAISAVGKQLERGGVAVVEPGRVRIRDLPIRDEP
jgi:predicted nuclease of predicted toxin-antitoxin system